jgi:hypothetical protein
MKFYSHYSIPAKPFNACPHGPTPDTITVNGRVITVQKFPEERVPPSVNEMPTIFGDKGHGPDADEATNSDHYARGTMAQAAPFGNRKTW